MKRREFKMEQAIAEHGSTRSGNYLASSPIIDVEVGTSLFYVTLMDTYLSHLKLFCAKTISCFNQTRLFTKLSCLIGNSTPRTTKLCRSFISNSTNQNTWYNSNRTYTSRRKWMNCCCGREGICRSKNKPSHKYLIYLSVIFILSEVKQVSSLHCFSGLCPVF